MAPQQDSKNDAETARYGYLDALGGVETLHARFVSHTFSRHFHERYALGCIESGAMGFRYRGENLVAPAGQVNLVVPGESHDGHSAHEAGWTYRMFYLPLDAVREAAAALMPKAAHFSSGQIHSGLPHFRPGVLNDPALAACVRMTHRAVMDPDVTRLEKETRLFWLLVHWINRHADEGGEFGRECGVGRGRGRDKGKAGLAREYLDANLAEDVSLEQLSGLCALSRFQLVRVFRREFGITPHTYLIQARVRRARDLLRATELRLADVAVETGFCDQAHLTRLFRRQFGTTPGQWRNNLQIF